MKTRFAVLLMMMLLVSGASAPAAQKVVQKLEWDKAPERAELVRPTTNPADNQVKIVCQSGQESVTLRVIERPGIRTKVYGLIGDVKYEDVQGRGYLEMWSRFADGGMYFSRTLGDFGPMKSLSETSDWRKFSLPFISKENHFPTELAFNMVFKGRGTVWIRNVKLVEYPNGLAAQSGRAGWWGDWQGGWIGGGLGSLLGFWGALVGILVSLGRAKRLVTASSWMVLGLGLGALGAGLVAVAFKQPYAVWYPLVLLGVLASALGPTAGFLARNRYAQMELSRMHAMDAG